MSDDDRPILTDQAYLTGVQYRTQANLAARQSIYSWQVPKIDLVASVLELAALAGAETVLDVGCGNGGYVAELARRWHGGHVIGADLSPGMLAAAHAAAPSARLIRADAAALPLADAVADVTLAPHMLYHLPDPAVAVAEFRRVTRAGGQVLVVLNSADHLSELRRLVHATARADCQPLAGFDAEEESNLAMTTDIGERLVGSVFGSVVRYDFAAELVLTAAEPVAGYVASLHATQSMPDPAGFTAAVAARVPFGPDGAFRVRTRCGLLICR
jgi:SAM-dependent methyltransferase